MFGNMGMGEIALIMVVILLLFGAKRIPEIAGSFGNCATDDTIHTPRNVQDHGRRLRGRDQWRARPVGPWPADGPDHARDSTRNGRNLRRPAQRGATEESKPDSVSGDHLSARRLLLREAAEPPIARDALYPGLGEQRHRPCLRLQQGGLRFSLPADRRSEPGGHWSLWL